MDFKEFLENTTLNEITRSVSLEVLDIVNFDNINFSNFCPICERETTFKTNINNDVRYDFQIAHSNRSLPHSDLQIGAGIHSTPFFTLSSNAFYLDKEDNRFIDFSFTIKCTCQQCDLHKTYFLVNVQSRTKNNDFTDEKDKFYKDSISDFVISKKGIYPQQDLTLNKNVQKFLDRESRSWYYKGNKCLNEGLAIGAFAYFRRIIEKELLHIVEFVKKVNLEKADEIDILIKEYNDSGKKANVIYDGIFQHLPTSLQGLGGNPIKVLYNKTSGGLHEYNEEHCTELSKSINKLLEFVIEKLYEEREKVSLIKNILKDMK